MSGRGELQMAILIEMMRREGYEMQAVGATRSSRGGSAVGEARADEQLIGLSGGVRRDRHGEVREFARAA